MFKTSAPDPEHLIWLKGKGYTADSKHYDASLEPLKQKLLSFGGHAVILHFAVIELRKIMERGQIECGNRAMLVRGEPSACHDNAYRLWLGDPQRVTLCTGYALSDDGLWRQHSWAKLNGDIIETTVHRVAYFGFELTNEEARAW